MGFVRRAPAVIPVGLFSAPEKHLFEHADRVFPIYFHFPFQIVDDVTVDLPTGLQVNSLPPAEDGAPGKAVSYALSAESKKGTLHWNRRVTPSILFSHPPYYPPS